jgi:hypothetical protein
VAFWRWEQIEKGRDGNVVAPEKMHVVAITMFGKYRVDATINPQNQIQRIKTTVSIPALGDFNIEHESTDQRPFGNVKWPIRWHSHQGWDDNWQFYRKSTGHNAYGGMFPDVRPNACGDPVSVPRSVAEATFETDEIADGVYLLGGGPSSPISSRSGRRPSLPRDTTTRQSRRTTSLPTTRGSCVSTTCSRSRMSPGC